MRRWCAGSPGASGRRGRGRRRRGGGRGRSRPPSPCSRAPSTALTFDSRVRVCRVLGERAFLFLRLNFVSPDALSSSTFTFPFFWSCGGSREKRGGGWSESFVLCVSSVNCLKKMAAVPFKRRPASWHDFANEFGRGMPRVPVVTKSVTCYLNVGTQLWLNRYRRSSCPLWTHCLGNGIKKLYNNYLIYVNYTVLFYVDSIVSYKFNPPFTLFSSCFLF